MRLRQNLSAGEIDRGALENSEGWIKERLKIVRGKEGEAHTHTEFWLVPAGADKPDFDEAEWDLAFPEKPKAVCFLLIRTGMMTCVRAEAS